MKNLICFFLLAMLTTQISYAQVNGPIVVSNSETVCVTDAAVETTYTRITISRVGENYPEQKIYLDGNGDAVTLTGTSTVQLGGCVAMAIDDYEILEACDFDETTNVGTQFLRLVKIEADGTTTVTTIDLTGAAYTPTGTVYDEFCGGYDTINGEQKIPGNGATVTLTDSPYLEWTVTNSGLDIGTITYGGVTVPAIIGMTWQCEFQVDPNTYSIRYCGDVEAADGDFYFSSVKQ